MMLDIDLRTDKKKRDYRNRNNNDTESFIFRFALCVLSHSFHFESQFTTRIYRFDSRPDIIFTMRATRSPTDTNDDQCKRNIEK